VSDCPICELEDRYEMETKVLKGKMTKRELAEHANCRVDEVYEHMTKHLIQRNALEDTSSKRNILVSSVDRLTRALENLNYNDSQSPAATKQAVQLAAEVRKTIMDLNELEGKKQSEQTITIEHYNDFRSVIVAKITKMYPRLCPECQKLWTDMIEDLEEPNDTVITAELGT